MTNWELFRKLCLIIGGQSQHTLAEVIDRLPMGVILIDAERQPVICNRSAEQITKLDDGFGIK